MKKKSIKFEKHPQNGRALEKGSVFWMIVKRVHTRILLGKSDMEPKPAKERLCKVLISRKVKIAGTVSIMPGATTM